ncbi:DUF3231 family protein [Lentibacillus jeotgali]|uniref:DUF3231 family protein n=1 Tax=Lentibacillus jeotgali TaxID=558169 RepID=UPI0002627442|nr:DUF3231 family protein [Lentibacillus jeotgali]
MSISHQTNLTAAELNHLWLGYLHDTLVICEMTYFLNHVKDPDIRELLSYALQLSETHVEKLTSIFNKEQYPVPKGFTIKEDVDVNAPRLFSDSYMLVWLQQFGRLGMNAYSEAVATVTRQDVFAYFSQCLSETNDILKKSNELMLAKGLYKRPPSLPTPGGIDFVKSQQFLTGWFGDNRPLTSTEIINLHSNIERNDMGMATLIGYSQVARSKEVTRYFLRGIEIAEKHINVFRSILEKSDLPAPTGMKSEVTDSTKPVFSDKFMAFKGSELIGISLGYYGASMAGMPRRDVGVDYARLIAEIGKYAEDGGELLIKNGWLEQPPRAADRDELAKKKD